MTLWKPDCLTTILGIFPREMKNIILCRGEHARWDWTHGRWAWNEHRTTWEKAKIAFWVERSSGNHIWSVWLLQVHYNSGQSVNTLQVPELKKSVDTLKVQWPIPSMNQWKLENLLICFVSNSHWTINKHSSSIGQKESVNNLQFHCTNSSSNQWPLFG